MTIITIYALLGDDLRIIFSPKSGDPWFLMGTAISMVMFSIEIILASIAKEGYFGSFFFWLDLISTVSLFTDIEPIMDALTGGNSNDAADSAAIARASRGARIGTRAGRIARIVRLIRLIRIVKLYKQADQAFRIRQQVTSEDIGQNDNQELEGYEGIPDKIDLKELLTKDYKESQVGKKLSELTTRRTVIMVLSMLFITPILSTDNYVDEPINVTYGLALIRALDPSMPGGINAFTYIRKQ